MIIQRFDLEKVKKAKSASEVYKIMEIDFRDKEIFGEKAYYRNVIMNDKTYKAIFDQLNTIRYKGELPVKSGRISREAITWMAFCPISTGPRMEEVSKRIGIIDEDKLYIITPEDKDLYEQSPEVEKEVSDESSASNT